MVPACPALVPAGIEPLRGSSQRSWTWPLHSGMNTRSGGRSPTTWYAMCSPPRSAYRVSGAHPMAQVFLSSVACERVVGDGRGATQFVGGRRPGGRLVDRATSTDRGRSAGADPRRDSTYGELANRVRRLAHGLTELGVRPGDRVGWLGVNHPVRDCGTCGRGYFAKTMRAHRFGESSDTQAVGVPYLADLLDTLGNGSTARTLRAAADAAPESPALRPAPAATPDAPARQPGVVDRDAILSLARAAIASALGDTTMLRTRPPRAGRTPGITIRAK
jgi:AMP-binding enzyme